LIWDTTLEAARLRLDGPGDLLRSLGPAVVDEFDEALASHEGKASTIEDPPGLALQ
jgi:hypothetical protein